MSAHTDTADFDLQLELVQLLIGTLIKGKERQSVAAAALGGITKGDGLVKAFASIRDSFFQTDATTFLLQLNSAASSVCVVCCRHQGFDSESQTYCWQLFLGTSSRDKVFQFLPCTHQGAAGCCRLL